MVHQRREAFECLGTVILAVEITGIDAWHVQIADRVAIRLGLRERAPADRDLWLRLCAPAL